MSTGRLTGKVAVVTAAGQGIEPKSSSDDLARYRAPALEKGLDILELLVAESQPLSVSVIAQKLGRSTGELFRMIQVLERRGFVEQAAVNGGYRLSGRLLSLGMDQSSVKTLVEIALPHMRQLSLDIGQSCHLAMHSEGQIVVVARMESSEMIGFSVRIGYRRPLMSTLSGTILYAFQPEIIRRRWKSTCGPGRPRNSSAFLQLRPTESEKNGTHSSQASLLLASPTCRHQFFATKLRPPR